MREYELTVVLHPDLEADLEAVLKKVRLVVTDNGGTITNEPMEIPGGEFAMNAVDPQGATVGFVGPRKA